MARGHVTTWVGPWITLALLLPSGVGAQTDSLSLRIVDVGPGLCTITRAPGDAWMVYDAGHWQGRRCIQAVRELVGTDEIDLVVISHSDGDHLGDADNILQEFTVRQFIHTGYEREGEGGANWRRMMDTVAAKVRHEGLSVRSLTTRPIVPGEQLELGADVTITFLGGWGLFPGAGLDEAEQRNAGSIVLRLDYAGRSIVFAGDAVGRHIDDLASTCAFAEETLVDRHRSNVFSLAADVLIAPHHGADNGSSSCFIEAVDPEWVVFSAGHAHEHPRDSTAVRYLDHGVPVDQLLRTDRGDDEGDDEWDHGRVPGCTDGRGDDDVNVVIWDDGAMLVGYLRGSSGC